MTIIALIKKWLVKNFKPPKNYYYYPLLGIAAFLVVIFFPLLTGQNNELVVREIANVHYIDSIGSNFLFRGGLPQRRHVPIFNYDGLKLAIIDAGKRARLKLPSTFYLIDVNLLNINNPRDAQWIFVEQEFFKTYPTLGQIQVWRINGTKLNANDPSLAANRLYLARNLDNWLPDKLVSRLKILRGWLEDSSPLFQGKTILPVVIYIHCVAGCDRTGELSGAYYLRYLNKSWEEVNDLNCSMCKHHRPIHSNNYRAIQWYCLWLNLEQGFDLHWWQDFPCD